HTGLDKKIRKLRRDPVYGTRAEKILKEWKKDELSRIPPRSPSSSTSSSICSSSSSTVSDYRRKSESLKHRVISGSYASSSGATKRKAVDASGEPAAKRTLVEETGDKPLWSTY
ncbi:hypothetical protein PMAYCL1PPCAC_01682, partial [Pristionchus mayeri]